MLLTKEVEMTWTHPNKKYYIEKGYNFTNYGDTFNCKVEDLSEKSSKDVQCRCDYCNTIYNKKYNKYVESHKNIDTDACAKCAPQKTRDICEILYGDRNYNIVKRKENQKYNIDKKINFLQKLISATNKKGYLLLPFIYKNTNQDLQYICKKHINLGVQYSKAYNLSLDVNNCYGCNCEHIKNQELFTFDYVKTIIESNGKNKLLSTIYTGARDRNLKITCAKCGNPYITSFNKYQNRNQIYCNDCSYKILRGGENNFKGGISSLNSFMRNAIKPWIHDSLKNSNYQCDISKKHGYLEVHHLHRNFKDIVDETLKNINIDVRKDIGQYTQDELNLLSSTCLSLHYKYVR